MLIGAQKYNVFFIKRAVRPSQMINVLKIAGNLYLCKLV